MNEPLISHMLDYLKCFIGVPYLWGGNNAFGFDCSGLVQEGLMSIGMDKKGDQTSHDLYLHFKQHGLISAKGPGALVFYGKPEKITHIAVMLNSTQIIEAGGGDDTTKHAIDAKNREAAMVRIRPIHYRKDIVDIIMPDYRKAYEVD